MTATARLPAIDAADAGGREVPADVKAMDPRGDTVFRATVGTWISPRPAR